MKRKCLFYRGLRKVYRIFFPPPTEEERKRKKQLQDYKYLISHGVETELGYVELFGYPIIRKALGSRIVIGKGVMLISESQYNTSGINHPCILSAEVAGAEIIIHDGVGMSGTAVVAVGRVEIGEQTMLGANTNVYETDFHSADPVKRFGHETIAEVPHAPIVIGKRCWIASNSTVLKGVTIGDETVVGAMSLVNRPLPPRVLAGGVPAKVIKQLNYE